jgi:predicted transcriptional regulator
MSVLLTEKQEQQLEDLARTRHRSKDELAQEAVDRFLDYEEHFAAAVREGIEAGERGELHSHESVKERINRRLAS